MDSPHLFHNTKMQQNFSVLPALVLIEKEKIQKNTHYAGLIYRVG